MGFHTGKEKSPGRQAQANGKRHFDLVIRTVGKACAAAKLALANLAYNFTRLAWLETCSAT